MARSSTTLVPVSTGGEKKIESVPVKKEKGKKLALSFDMDSCMLSSGLKTLPRLSWKVTELYNQGQPIEAAIEQSIMECHIDLIGGIVKQIEQGGYTDVVIMLGSARQTVYLDKSSAKVYQDNFEQIPLSSFRVLEGIQKVLRKKISEKVTVELDGFLLEDAFEGVKPGATFEKGLKNLDKNGAYRTPLALAEWPKAAFSTTEKVEIVYAQTNHLASKYRNEKIDYRLYDDKHDTILKQLSGFYSRNPHLLPEKIKIQSFEYSSRSSGYVSEAIEGRGKRGSYSSSNFSNFRLLLDHLDGNPKQLHRFNCPKGSRDIAIRSRLFEAHPGERVVIEGKKQTTKLSDTEVAEEQRQLASLLNKLKGSHDIASVCQYKKVHYALEYLEQDKIEIDTDKIQAIGSLLCEEEKHYSSHAAQSQIDITLQKIVTFNASVGIAFAPTQSIDAKSIDTQSVEQRTWWQERSPLTKAVIVGVVAAILVGAALTGVGLIVEAALGVSIVGASLFIGAGSFFSAGAFSTGIAAGGIGAAVVSGVSSLVSGIFYYIKQSCFPSPDAGVGNRDSARVLASHSLKDESRKKAIGGGSTFKAIKYVTSPTASDPRAPAPSSLLPAPPLAVGGSIVPPSLSAPPAGGATTTPALSVKKFGNL